MFYSLYSHSKWQVLGCLAVWRGIRGRSSPWLQPLGPRPGSLCRLQLERIGVEAKRRERQMSSGFLPGLTVFNKAPAKSCQDQVPRPATSAPNPGPPETIPIKVDLMRVPRMIPVLGQDRRQTDASKCRANGKRPWINNLPPILKRKPTNQINACNLR